MNPGRELDIRIARDLLGCRVVNQNTDVPSCGCPEIDEYSNRPHTSRTMGDGGHLKHYSLRIDAAWEIVEHLREQKKLTVISQIYHALAIPYYEYLAKVEWTDKRLGYQFEFARSESAPHAICLAALKTLEDRK